MFIQLQSYPSLSSFCCILLSVAFFVCVLQVDAFLMERNSLEDVYQLLTYCSECLAVWRLLCEHQFDLIANGLDVVSKLGEGEIVINGVVSGGHHSQN